MLTKHAHELGVVRFAARGHICLGHRKDQPYALLTPCRGVGIGASRSCRGRVSGRSHGRIWVLVLAILLSGAVVLPLPAPLATPAVAVLLRRGCGCAAPGRASTAVRACPRIQDYGASWLSGLSRCGCGGGSCCIGGGGGGSGGNNFRRGHGQLASPYFPTMQLQLLLLLLLVPLLLMLLLLVLVLVLLLLMVLKVLQLVVVMWVQLRVLLEVIRMGMQMLLLLLVLLRLLL